MLYRLLAEFLMILHFSWIIFMLAGFVFTVAAFWKSSLSGRRVYFKLLV